MAGRTNRTPKPKPAKQRTRSALDWAPRFLAELARTGNISRAASEARVGRRTVYDRRDNDPEFAAAMADAMEEATDALEAEARRRAVEGWDEPVYGSLGSGEGSGQVGVIRRFDSRLLLALLQAHRAEKFRNNHKVEHTGIPAQVNVYVPANGRDPGT